MDSRSGGEEEGFRLENPFTLKVGQVFTGFGIGCGVGIGVGRPLNLAAIPMLNQVMSATRGATDAFSGVTRHVNTSLKKLGAKNIEVGVGCGVGFGHGFGAGVAVKPGVLNQIQSCVMVAMTKMMMKLGIVPNLPFNPGAFSASFQSGINMVNKNQISPPSMMQLAVGSRTEKVISNFLQNPLLNGEEGGLDESGAGRLRSENNVLQMVLKHQRIIEELVEENEKLRQILVEDLKVPPSKLEANSADCNIPKSKGENNKRKKGENQK
ncbi:hypothetical protein AAHE18_05G041000 [Arachis hypogaea]